MARDRSTSTFSFGSGMAKPASKITSSKFERSRLAPFRKGDLGRRSRSRSTTPVSCSSPPSPQSPAFGRSCNMMLPGWRSPWMNWSLKIMRMYAAMLCLATCFMSSGESPSDRAKASMRVGASSGEGATLPPPPSAKMCVSSWPVSRDSTSACGVTYNGSGNRTASSPSEKFARNRRRCDASISKSVCIFTCSAKSSAAWRTPRRCMVSN
mmetsp:Transcript_19571/g.57033  ORF Transcript_19571/g.57033 Transcript_19571/m.57033 type:complete len:210 (-) Transcript_19571:905-1534(-)